MAQKVYPSRNSASFVVAEDVRIEATGKLTIAGLYPGGRIVIPAKPTIENPANLRLIFLITFQDGIGAFKQRFELVGPSGDVVYTKELDPVERTSDRSATIVVGISPLILKELGQFKVSAYLDQHEYAFPFFLQLPPVETGGKTKGRGKRPRKKGRAKSSKRKAGG